MGSMDSERSKLEQLRGKLGQQAADKAREVEELKRRELAKADETPLPQEVEELMKQNELEAATVVFSKQAIRLFSHMFGNSLENAMERSMNYVEQRLEHMVEAVIERKLTETMSYAATALSDLMPKVVPDPFTEFAKEHMATSREVNKVVPMFRVSPKDTPEVSPKDTPIKEQKVTRKKKGKYLMGKREQLRDLIKEAGGPVTPAILTSRFQEKYGVDIKKNIYNLLTRTLSTYPDEIKRADFGSYEYVSAE